jgi:AhpD family alkylhydroperoxidase
MSTNGRLTRKEKELIAVGASIAAGCQPCTAHHFKAAREAGATEAEIRQTVDEALSVRDRATKIMARVAEKHLGNEAPLDEQQASSKPLMGALVSIGAALAVNCTTSLEAHLQAVRAAGATDRQIQTALGIARNIKKVAGEKVEAVAKVVAEPTEAKTDDGGGSSCGCQEASDGQTREADWQTCLGRLRKTFPEQTPPVALWEKIQARLD